MGGPGRRRRVVRSSGGSGRVHESGGDAEGTRPAGDSSRDLAGGMAGGAGLSRLLSFGAEAGQARRADITLPVGQLAAEGCRAFGLRLQEVFLFDLVG